MRHLEEEKMLNGSKWSTKKFYELYPDGGIKQAARIAGIRIFSGSIC